MVFRNKILNDTGDIVVYSNYHKYWLDKERGIKNPSFDVFSGKILDLKECKIEAIEFFYGLIDKELETDITICVVPSSDSSNKKSGMVLLGEKLALNRRKNAVYFLDRFKSIDKLATGGNRSVMTHLNSIRTINEMSIEGDIVLLMDDVTTTGNSLLACKQLLEDAGAKNVEMFALGKAI